MLEFEVVDPGNCEELTSALLAADRVAIDTEFMREKTYYAQLCLIQIATHNKIFCADPLTDSDLSSFWDALNNCHWVLHSGRQDVEVFFQAANRMPSGLFDTQVAASLMGYAPQLGYAALVNELFGKELAKSHTRADWTRRPLPPEMIEYAAEDVEFLLDACDLLSEKLAVLGRLDWALEDSAQLLDPSLYEESPSAAIDRLKGARKLSGRARGAAASLAAWRERKAVQRNRPRQWILKDAVLLELAIGNPKDEREVSSIPGMPANTARNSATELLQIIASVPHDDPGYVPPARPDEQQKAVLKAMQTTVADMAATLGIAAEIIAPKKELSAAMRGERDSRVFRGWRFDIVGKRILELLI